MPSSSLWSLTECFRGPSSDNDQHSKASWKQVVSQQSMCVCVCSNECECVRSKTNIVCVCVCSHLVIVNPQSHHYQGIPQCQSTFPRAGCTSSITPPRCPPGTAGRTCKQHHIVRSRRSRERSTLIFYGTTNHYGLPNHRHPPQSRLEVLPARAEFQIVEGAGGGSLTRCVPSCSATAAKLDDTANAPSVCVWAGPAW